MAKNDDKDDKKSAGKAGGGTEAAKWDAPPEDKQAKEDARIEKLAQKEVDKRIKDGIIPEGDELLSFSSDGLYITAVTSSCSFQFEEK